MVSLSNKSRIGYSVWLIINGASCVALFFIELYTFLPITEDPYFDSIRIIRNFQYELYLGTDNLTDEEFIPLAGKCYGPSAAELAVIKDTAIEDFILNPPSSTTYNWSIPCDYPTSVDKIRRITYMIALSIQSLICSCLLLIYVDVPKHRSFQSDAIFTIAQNEKMSKNLKFQNNLYIFLVIICIINMGVTCWETIHLETLVFSLGMILSPSLSTILAMFTAVCGQQVFVGAAIIIYGRMISKEAKIMSKSKIRLNSGEKKKISSGAVDNVEQLYLENTDDAPIPLIQETLSAN